MTDIKDTLAALSEAATYAEWQQRRGRLADAVDWAILEYDEFMKDDAYDSQRVLDRIIARLRDVRDTSHDAYRTGQLVPAPSVDPLRSAPLDRLGYAERVEKAVALLRLLHDESPAAISADDPRLEPFCDDYYPVDTFNALCDIGLIDQIGSADFDDYRAVLLPEGEAVIAAMQEGRDG